MLSPLEPIIAKEKDMLYSERSSHKYTDACVFTIAMNIGDDSPLENSRSAIDWLPLCFRDELDLVMNYLRANVLTDRETMIDYCKSNPQAKVACEMGTYGFVSRRHNYTFYLRCMEVPRGEESDYYITVYDKSVMALMDAPKKPVLPGEIVINRRGYQPERKPATDWAAIGRMCRITGAHYGDLVAQGKIR